MVHEPLWDNFELPEGTLPSRLFEESLQSSQEFTVCNCRSMANGNRYNLVFRSAQAIKPHRCLSMCVRTLSARRLIPFVSGRTSPLASYRQACISIVSVIVDHHNAMLRSAPPEQH